MIQIFIALLLMLFSVWLFYRAFGFLLGLMAPPTDIVLVPFDADNENQKKLSTAVLSAELQQLQTRGTDAPTGYGFLNVPLLLSVPQQFTESTSTLDGLNKIELKIKDIDVPALIRTFNELLSVKHYELRGSINELPTARIITCRLVRTDKIIKTWQIIGKRTTSTEGIPSENGLEDLLDQLMYQVIFDLAKEPKFERWGIQLQGEHRFGNWQSLRAWLRGLRALRVYQKDLDHQDLEEALKFFESLAILSPDDMYGLYFRGLALSENRQEHEAVGAFEQLQRVLQRQPKSETTKRMQREAKLNEATARLKFYEKGDAEKAITSLNELIEELARDLKAESSKDTDEGIYIRKLLAVSYAQLAYTHGTILVLGPRNNVEELEDHIDKMNENLKLADDTFTDLAAKWQSERQKRDTHMRILNAHGYGRFRAASVEAKDDAEYRTFCGQAIDFLEQANEERSNHYEVLQNLGMIYANARFDPDGNSLDQAKRLFERTTKFVPEDYYQYEQLALIYWRQVKSRTEAELAKPDIVTGIEMAHNALKRRPQARTALQVLALLAKKSWEVQDRKDGDEANAAIRAFREASHVTEGNEEFWNFKSEYIDFLKELGKIRNNNAVGLNEVTDLLIKFASQPEVKGRRREIVQIANTLVTRSLQLSKNSEPERIRAEELKQEVEKLAASVQ